MSFLANMSHEIRAHMNGILGFSELIRYESEEPSIREKAEIVNRSGAVLMELIDDILDLSRIEAGRMELFEETFDFYELLKQTHMLQSIEAERKGLDFRFEIDPDMQRFIVSDRKKLQQVITNLLNNAVKFTNAGGVIMTAELLSRREKNVYIKISVTDTGIGIPNEAHEMIFRPSTGRAATSGRFFSRIGLGLVISKSFVEMLGGSIWVNSEVNRGATFSFVFAAGVPAEEERYLFASAPENNRKPGSLRVVVADNNDYNRLLMEFLLKREASSVYMAGTVDEVVEILSNREVDLVFFDSGMKGADGGHLAGLIRADDRFDSVSLVAFVDGPGETPAGDIDAFLEKPVTKRAFLEVIEKLYPRVEDEREIKQAAAVFQGLPVLSPEIEEAMRTLSRSSLDRRRDRKKAVAVLKGLMKQHKQYMGSFSMILEAINSFDFNRASELIRTFNAWNLHVFQETANNSGSL